VEVDAARQAPAHEGRPAVVVPVAPEAAQRRVQAEEVAHEGGAGLVAQGRGAGRRAVAVDPFQQGAFVGLARVVVGDRGAVRPETDRRRPLVAAPRRVDGARRRQQEDGEEHGGEPCPHAYFGGGTCVSGTSQWESRISNRRCSSFWKRS